MSSLKQYYLYAAGLLLFAQACRTSRQTLPTPETPAAQKTIDSLRAIYAPDKRTAVFDITANGTVLTGETNLPGTKTLLLRTLPSTYVDSIRLLPDISLGGDTTAIVSISVANLRVKPGHPNEMATQATLGTPLKVLKKERGWYLVQTPDRYIAWTEAGGIKLMDTPAATQWQSAEKAIYTKPYGFAYTMEDTESATVSDLVYGDVIAIQGRENNFYKAGFPDGRTAYIPLSEMTLYKDWAASRQPTQENLVKAAKKLMGIPYLWGGTSFKGVDCSGFTRTVYFMNGLLLPRDASQQANIGREIDTKNGWQNLQAGDLIFFGTPARDGKPERVIHVGMWLGGANDEFIQSASKVQISSFNPNASNYDAYELRRFLRAKRITPGDVLYDLRTRSFY
ncbi:MAG TPA: C40 family peptidase [Puia sp.]|nr:C40 family peptidase [Puia sp.]